MQLWWRHQFWWRHYLSGSKIKKQLNNNKCLVLQLGLLSPAGAPRAERRPGDSWNMTEFRFCELQNRRKQCRSFVPIMMRSQKKKKFFTGILTIFSFKIRRSRKKRSHMLVSKCHLMGSFQTMGSLMGTPKSMGLGVFIPPCPPSRWPCSPVHIGVYCTLTVPVQVFLVLLQRVTGLALSYVPVAGNRYHTRLILAVK